MGSDDVTRQIARIEQLLAELRDPSNDAREEVLLATEQLLAAARNHHNNAVANHRRAVNGFRARKRGRGK